MLTRTQAAQQRIDAISWTRLPTELRQEILGKCMSDIPKGTSKEAWDTLKHLASISFSVQEDLKHPLSILLRELQNMIDALNCRQSKAREKILIAKELDVKDTRWPVNSLRLLCGESDCFFCGGIKEPIREVKEAWTDLQRVKLVKATMEQYMNVLVRAGTKRKAKIAAQAKSEALVDRWLGPA